MQKISIIIPVYQDDELLRKCIEHLHCFGGNHEIIVVDGAATSQAKVICKDNNVCYLQSQKGRGLQCNAGAFKASGDLFFFLHADSILCAEAFKQIEEAFRDDKVQVARFRLCFDHPHWLLKVYGAFTRLNSIWTRFGDQGIIVRKDFFEVLGSFPDWPIFEDVHFFKLARKKTRIYLLPGPITTSSRKFIKNGIIRQQWKNFWLIIKYLRGVSPEILARQYYS